MEEVISFLCMLFVFYYVATMGYLFDWKLVFVVRYTILASLKVPLDHFKSAMFKFMVDMFFTLVRFLEGP